MFSYRIFLQDWPFNAIELKFSFKYYLTRCWKQLVSFIKKIVFGTEGYAFIMFVSDVIVINEIKLVWTFGYGV